MKKWERIKVPSLAITKMKLLSESKNLISAIESESWQQYLALNSLFQQHLAEAIELFGDAIEETVAELLRDNDEIQSLVRHKQHHLLKESKAEFSRIKQLKAYISPTE